MWYRRKIIHCIEILFFLFSIFSFSIFLEAINTWKYFFILVLVLFNSILFYHLSISHWKKLCGYEIYHSFFSFASIWIYFYISFTNNSVTFSNSKIFLCIVRKCKEMKMKNGNKSLDWKKIKLNCVRLIKCIPIKS